MLKLVLVSVNLLNSLNSWPCVVLGADRYVRHSRRFDNLREPLKAANNEIEPPFLSRGLANAA